jgi:hypothetical protein
MAECVSKSNSLGCQISFLTEESISQNLIINAIEIIIRTLK